MSLVPFVNKHAGKTAWLFGKGSSFDAYLESDAYRNPDPDIVTMAVNEAALVVPNPTYFFAHDLPNVERCFSPREHILKDGQDYPHVRAEFPANTIAVLREGHEVAAVEAGIDVATRVVTYVKAQKQTQLLHLVPEELAESGLLYGESSTIQSACHFAKLVGCTKVVLIGVDGGKGLAKVFQPLSCIKGYWYTKNKGDTHRVLKKMGMPFEVWKEQPCPH